MAAIEGRTTPATDVLAQMWSRRAVLGAGVGGAMALGLAGRAAAQGAPGRSAVPAGSRRPIAPVEPGELSVLVNRTTQGFTESIGAEAQSRGYQGFLEWQLDYMNIDDSALNAVLAAFPTLTLTSKQIYDTYVTPGNQFVPFTELKKAMLLRSILSKRQLFERMVEFWTDHLNIDQADNECQWLKTADDRDVIRTYALAKFPDMLKASARSGAMLFYLDNFSNRATGVNENYSREVMELHTISVGNYTDAEVRELARCLTGWTMWRPADPNYGDFRYRADWHDNGSKQLLGLTIPANGGITDGDTLLDFLANHTLTAHFVATKMCKWLLAYAPSQALINSVANTYMATGGDIKAMIRVILNPDNVALAQPHLFPKLRRPYHFMTSLLRASNATTSTSTGAQNLLNELTKLGQLPFAWGTPDGLPDTLEFWGQAVLPRWSFASRVIDNLISGVSISASTLFSGVPQNQLADRANQLLSGGHLDAADRDAVHAYVMSFGSVTQQLQRDTLALMASSPSYQYY